MRRHYPAVLLLTFVALEAVVLAYAMKETGAW